MFLHFHLSGTIFAFFLPRFRNYINANSFWNKKISISQHIHRRLQLSERKSCKSAVDYFQIQSRYIFTIKSLYNNELKQNTKHLLTLNSECFSLFKLQDINILSSHGTSSLFSNPATIPKFNRQSNSPQNTTVP